MSLKFRIRNYENIKERANIILLSIISFGILNIISVCTLAGILNGVVNSVLILSDRKLSVQQIGVLNHAVDTGDIHKVQDYIKKHKKAVMRYLKKEKQIGVNQSLLHRAVKVGRDKIAEILITHQAGVNNTDYYHKTPLHYASEVNAIKCLELLINYGADINLTDEYNLSALHYAAGNGCKEAVEKLLNSGAFIGMISQYGDTPLHAAVYNVYWSQSCQHVQEYADHSDIIKLLITRGINIDAANRKDAETALHIAASYGNIQALSLLLDGCADVNAINHQGHTPLISAVLGFREKKPKFVYRYANPCLQGTRLNSIELSRCKIEISFPKVILKLTIVEIKKRLIAVMTDVYVWPYHLMPGILRRLYMQGLGF